LQDLNPSTHHDPGWGGRFATQNKIVTLKFDPLIPRWNP
jgi:hypothetical protein